MERSKRTITAVTVFLVIFHQVGVLGLHLPSTQPLFEKLIPLNLLLSLGVIALFHRVWSTQFSIFLFIIFWAGYLVEVVGVGTEAIFGAYTYGDSLGFKIAGVPPIMGVNWILTVYLTGVVSQSLGNNIWTRSALGAGLMVLLDFFIEPMAMKFDMWDWPGHVVPLQNYFAWFVIGFAMQFGFHSLQQEKSNPLAMPLFLIQLIFFASILVISI